MFFNKNKKGQLFLISSFLLFFSVLFIYSLETENTYITSSSKNGILGNIIYESCQVGIKSNGSYIDLRYSEFTSNVSNYCDNLNYVCSLTIIKKGGAPTNLSDLNYTHYDYNINYENEGFVYTNDFTCES
jgi:uncharacterized membrane protein